MDGKPKKTRQRNRPRNKANRLKEEIGQTSNSELNKTTETVPLNAANIVGQQSTLVKERANDNYKEQTQVTTSDSELPTQKLIDSDNNLRLLQQMMRTKLRQKRQNSENDNIDAKATVKVNKSNQKSATNLSKGKESGQASNVKAASSKRNSPDNSLLEQSAFVASLQKKLKSSVANGLLPGLSMPCIYVCKILYL